MLFNSFQFLVFFIIVTGLYFFLPHNKRWLLLLISSCYFYMAFVPIYILILGFTIVVDYFAGRYIEDAKGQRRRLYLIVSLIANIGVLAIFKYYNFLNDNLTFLFHGAGWTNPIPYLSILLPIGLSFHTFQAMSYTIEVYRGNQKAERHFGIYSLYVMFYPQLVAGPIERPQNLLPQFREYHKFSYPLFTSGLKLMLWGLFKKIVIADRFAIMVNEVYSNQLHYNGFAFILATMLFAIQIYCDFSGYSDIAIGAARVMGFNLMINFKQPFFSTTVSEFWSRWHISLSSWFRDYLYIPLGGNRVRKSRLYFNVLLVFGISGLWHGANWTYILWGLLHGIYIVVTLMIINKFPQIRLSKYIKIIITFFLVCFAFIFFRASSIQEASEIIAKIFSLPSGNYFKLVNYGYHENYTYLGMPQWKFLLSLLWFPFIIFCDWLILNKFHHKLNFKPAYYRWSVYIALIFMILVFGVYESNQFIYFQF